MPTACNLPALAACLRAERSGFVADYVEAALEAAVDDGPALCFRENGMTDPTPYGQAVEDDAADEAAAVFDRLLAGYLAEAARFTPSGPYNDAAEHTGNEYKGAVSPVEQDVFERLVDAHAAFLYPPKPSPLLQEEAYTLLKARLEFADLNSAPLLTALEQAQFSTILQKLRWLAAG